MPRAYRVHGEQLQIGASVPASEVFGAAAQEDDRGAIEERFEELRPASKPTRQSAVFVFESIDAAKRFITPKQNHFLYEVDVRGEPRHRGDWTWLDKARQSPETIDECAHSYWAGSATDSPVWEWVVGEAVATQDVSPTAQERADLRKQHYGLPTGQEIADSFRGDAG